MAPTAAEHSLKGAGGTPSPYLYRGGNRIHDQNPAFRGIDGLPVAMVTLPDSPSQVFSNEPPFSSDRNGLDRRFPPAFLNPHLIEVEPPRFKYAALYLIFYSLYLKNLKCALTAVNLQYLFSISNIF